MSEEKLTHEQILFKIAAALGKELEQNLDTSNPEVVNRMQTYATTMLALFNMRPDKYYFNE